jgi:hypothetical protein
MIELVLVGKNNCPCDLRAACSLLVENVEREREREGGRERSILWNEDNEAICLDL